LGIDADVFIQESGHALKFPMARDMRNRIKMLFLLLTALQSLVELFMRNSYL